MSSAALVVSPEMNLDVRGNRCKYMEYCATLTYILATNDGRKVDVFSYRGEHLRVFEEHTDYSLRIAHLFGDIVASVDFGNNIISWDAVTGKMLCKFHANSQVVNFAASNMNVHLY